MQEELTDALVKGEEIDWEKTFKNAVDGGLIGAFSTAPANIIPSPSGQATEQDSGQVVDGEIPNAEPMAQPEGAIQELNVPAVEDTNVAERTQGFFGDVVEGNLDKYKPSQEYQYELDFSESRESFKDTYDKFRGNFDEHIATSIPTFRDTQIKKGNAIVETLGEGLVIDLGGSEGGL